MLTTKPAQRAGRREWIALAVLALPTVLLSLDISVLYLALPELGSGLGASGTEQLWIMDIYSFMLAGFLVTMGTLGDRIGRRRLLMIGAVAFGLVSVLAAYATSPEMLIAARALLGVAGATLMPSTMALIRNMFTDPRQMGTAVGVWFACFVGGMALGPVAGGFLLEHFWWGSVFLLGVPVMLLLLIVGPALLPEYRDAEAGRLDLASVALSLAAILPVIYGLKEPAREGWSTTPALALAAGLGCGYAFVRRQRGLAEPLLDLRLFAGRTFTVALAIMLLGGVVMSGATLMSTQYLQLVEGFSPLNAGLWMLPQNVALVVGSMAGPALARRFRPAHVIALGMALGAAGFALHTQIGGTGGLPLLVTGLVLSSAGIAMPMTLTMNLMLAGTPPEKAGSVASISETGGEFGVALGVATMGTLGTVVYRDRLADTMPNDIPAASAATARESMATALEAAAGLPANLTADLLTAARDAFATGLNAVALVGVAAFVTLGILAATTLRTTPQPSATDTDTPAEEALVPTAH
ncbi:MFS transporter [Thermomonospora umbrina]|uniref:DHA2 family multidrug resistance protein-like MFS transporter n=1 Tax=Thermomonospora umbrina TaxID=111806 RepID=A0A3D9SQ07_9ACTN|nr:MFS transporter [Thermomonospora umbrina]REE97697.1 DHA2 family multidrug resistance protein-like MFS transporter [Thermomonospora umbrina]